MEKQVILSKQGLDNQSSIKVEDIVKWILVNRKGNVWRDFSEDEVRWSLLEGMKNNACGVITDDKGTIIAVALGKTNHQEKILTIDHIRCLNKEGLLGLIRYFFLHWPGYTIDGLRRGKYMKISDINKYLKRALIYGRN